MGWIVGAIMRACARCRALPLDVRVVIFRGPVPRQLEEMQERMMQEVAGAREAAAEGLLELGDPGGALGCLPPSEELSLRARRVAVRSRYS